MTGTLSEVFGWTRNKIVSYLVIVAVLLGGAWAQREIGKIAEIEKLLKSVEADIKGIDDDLQKLKSGKDPLGVAYVKALRVQQQKEQERDDFKSNHPVLAKIPFTTEWKDLRQLDAEVVAYTAVSDNAARLVNEKTKLLAKERQARLALKAEYDEDLKLTRKWKELLPTFWLAAVILFTAVITGIAIKVFLYFVIAPLASRRPPIQILPDANGAIVSRLTPNTPIQTGKASSVSRSIFLKDKHQLLIRPEYLQSTSDRAKKATQWLLNAEIPYGSLLSGMFLLTKVESPETDEIVVSATRDPLSEVCFIELLDSSAFVCQPRALVGVIQDPAQPIRISRHWRLRSLQSWLTFQLRFLVFHGPGQLIIKGCRGVRIEQSGKGRIINQAATLGFSANIVYANTRCETFMSYWMGKDDLFNDIFTGDGGSYLYEEMPDLKHKSGIAGRGLEGVLDSALKVFGL